MKKLFHSDASPLMTSLSTSPSSSSTISQYTTQSHSQCSYVYSRKDYDWQLQQHLYSSIAEINVVSFNMLAPVYKRLSSLDLSTGYRKREASNTTLWKARGEQTLKFFDEELFKTTDIIGLQEFWLTDRSYLQYFTKAFQEHNYGMYSLQRTGDKSDAVVLLVKNTIFEMIQSENVYLCSEGDRVALLLWLKHRITGKEMLVANTHLSFPHTLADRMNQMQQMKKLTNAMDNFAQRHGIRHVTRLVMGDFNVESNSPVCDHLRNSGFYSCFEVHPPENDASPEIETFETAVSDSPSQEEDEDDPSIVKNLHYQHDDHRDEDYPANRRPDGLCPKPLVSFVSHRNHHQEEVGVDHIFVKPGSRLLPVLNTQNNGGVNHRNNQMLYIFQNESHFPHSRPSFSRIDPIPSMGISHDAQSHNSLELSDEEAAIDGSDSTLGGNHLLTYQVQEGVFVNHCAVLPRSLSCKSWNEAFHISDHRPVSVTLVFGRKKG